jgi:XTP/dITP diphosphohydrolase
MPIQNFILDRRDFGQVGAINYMKIVLATRNKKKLEELKRLLEGLPTVTSPPIELFSLMDFPGLPEVIEDGLTFEENAVKKAQFVAKATGLLAIADDSGLVVDSLGGAPGVYSARYAGEPSDDKRNIEKLLKELSGVPVSSRQAYFICVIALAFPDGKVRTFTGRVDGIITKEPRGEKGFGYDPVFQPEGLDRTFAELSPEEKDAMSHRMKAISQLKEYLRSLLDTEKAVGGESNSCGNQSNSSNTLLHRHKFLKLLLFFILGLSFLVHCYFATEEAHAFSEKGDCKTCHKLTVSEAQQILSGGPDLKVTNVLDSPLKGLWEVNFESQGRKGLVYIDYSKKFIIAGNIFSSSSKQNLTQERLSILNRVDPSKIDIKDALVLGKKGAKYKVIVFDDPD